MILRKSELLNKKKKGGYTLIELLIVIAAIIGATAIGLTLYSQYQESNYVKNEVTNISSLKTKIEDRYRTLSTSEEGLNNLIAVQGGLVPKTLKSNSTGSIVNSFGGSVVIDVEGTDGYYIEYAKVKSGGVCTEIVSTFYQNFTSITIGSTTITPTSNQNSIATACSATPELVVRFTDDQV